MIGTHNFILMGTSKNSNFFVRARKLRPENRSSRGVNEDSRTELMCMDGPNTGFAGAKTCKPLSRKKCIFRDALITIILLSVLYSGVQVVYGLAESDIPERTEALWFLVFSLLVAMWIVKEFRQADKSPLSNFGMIAFIA